MTQTSSPDLQPATLSPLHLRLIMVLVTGALFMEILDASIIITALPSMARDFHSSAVGLNIGVSAYLVTLGILIPASGWIAERFGTRRIFTLAIALFTLASALCGQAGSLAEFVALRVFQGAAGAMMVPVGQVIVLHCTPRDKLMVAMSNLIWPALIAPVVGPPIGGFITQHLSWNWIFYLNVPVGLIAMIAAWKLVPDSHGGDSHRAFDWRGFAITAIGTFALLAGMEMLGATGRLPSLALIGAGLVILLFAYRHMRRHTAPMVRLDNLAIVTFKATIRGGSLSRAGVASVPFLVPLLLQVGFGYSPSEAGLVLIALFAGNLAMKSVTTPVLRTFGYRRVLIGSSLATFVGIAGGALLTPTTPIPVICAFLFFSGMTRSMHFTTLGTMAFSDIPKPQMGDATSLFNTSIQLMMASGIALSALAVKLGGPLAEKLGASGPDMGYRFAFLPLSLLCLATLVEALRLPRDAGDSFVGRKSGT
ncbi:MFS transporter [Novosphingobium sp. 1949]|uniref:MFS transporter n=1 Tax=Novosphingobium organovorum TaxID=2930092 RepID=A0ABT0BB77_9SPHN|nr:MFS transporter [Novosphingobium organovorum]MCJ2182314.1 MFS transporter [Novosphingobium organovorum]